MRDKSERVGIDFTGEKSRTKQSFVKEANINYIMAKYLKTGQMNENAVNRRNAVFADVSETGDYQECHATLETADRAFNTLSAEVRTRFNNDPAQLLDFCADSNNRDEAIALGIITAPPEPEPPPEPPTPPPETPTE